LRRFGHSAFRPGQREAIDALLQHGRLLLVAPTGGGKSLTYQLPAVMLGGTALVVSPLVALMQDQVDALTARGVPATYLASTIPGDELRQRMRAVRRGEVRLLYVAPERLAYPGFRALVQELRPPLVAIDEAHCISEWGHDFRPDYLRMHELLALCPQARVLACTATATPVVRDDILSRLGLDPDTPQILRGFARPNLALAAREVSGSKEAQGAVDACLRSALGAPGGVGAAIVYSPTRRRSETEAARLAARGWKAVAYHAGMSGEVRAESQRSFIDGEAEVVVATNAFGMGIDRADVRAVIHLAPPSSVEAYYQEVGRAGRDGAKAWGLMLLSPRDLPLRRRLIETAADGLAPSPEVIEHKWGLFLELVRWAEGGSCRHDAILRYFGDEDETLSGCGLCDVCERLAEGHTDEPHDAAEVTLLVRKALSGVARVHGRFGLRAAALLLCGKADDRLQWSRLDKTSTYGVLADRPMPWVRTLLRRCVTAGWVDFAGGERPLAVLTGAGREVMKGNRPARLLLPPKRRAKPARGGAARSDGRAVAGAGDDALDPLGAEVFEALRRHRMSVAKAGAIPAYMVASDRTLRDVAMLRPRTADELMQAHGIGSAKLERYGEGLLRVVREVVGGVGAEASAGGSQA
jgi:ATP-dependent DNA helicase RecQ